MKHAIQLLFFSCLIGVGAGIITTLFGKITALPLQQERFHLSAL
jgi:ABC-type spermidine/putrescine transport system permease subunit II